MLDDEENGEQNDGGDQRNEGPRSRPPDYGGFGDAKDEQQKTRGTNDCTQNVVMNLGQNA